MLAIPILIQTHRWVVIGTLADKNFRVVIPLRGHVRAEMPFAHHRGGVACLLEKLGEGLLGSVELVSIHQKPIGVGILAGLNRCTHRPADRVGDVALLEKHTVPGKRIDVRGGAMLLQPGIVGTDGLVSMVIRKDEKNIGLFLCTQGKRQ